MNEKDNTGLIPSTCSSHHLCWPVALLCYAGVSTCPAGTGVLVVRLTDVNDNSPRLEQKQWEVEVDETWGAGPPDNVSLLEVSVLDVDTSNYFFYRVRQNEQE